MAKHFAIYGKSICHQWQNETEYRVMAERPDDDEKKYN